MRKYFVAATLLLVGLFAGQDTLQAGSFTFAQFTEVSGTNSFSFVNNGDGTASFTDTSSVYFTFTGSAIPAADLLLGPLPEGAILATLTKTGIMMSSAFCSALCDPESLANQGIVDSTLVIREQDDGALLLESADVVSMLTGNIADSVINLRNSSFQGSLVFRSDFVDFSSTNAVGRWIALGSASSGLSGAAPGTGVVSFSADFTPEPGSASLVGVGGLALLFLTARRRRQRQN
jgi:hypothetical protein